MHERQITQLREASKKIMGPTSIPSVPTTAAGGRETMGTPPRRIKEKPEVLGFRIGSSAATSENPRRINANDVRLEKLEFNMD